MTRVLDQAGYQAALRTKLLEEAREAQAAPDGQLSAADRKRAERGGFGHRIFLEYVDQAQ